MEAECDFAEWLQSLVVFIVYTVARVARGCAGRNLKVVKIPPHVFWYPMGLLELPHSRLDMIYAPLLFYDDADAAEK